MKKARNWIMKLASSAAALALVVAVSSVSATCFFVVYQPDVPESLR